MTSGRTERRSRRSSATSSRCGAARFIRFVVGRYGSGKSFFLNVIKAVALEKKFLVARADITTERRLYGRGGQARALYQELMRNLATRSRPEGGALASVIERWVGEVAQDARTKGGGEDAIRRRVQELTRPLQDLVGGFDFAEVVCQYQRGHDEHDEERQVGRRAVAPRRVLEQGGGAKGPRRPRDRR